jgi:HK97 family phage major capsid protein
MTIEQIRAKAAADAKALLKENSKDLIPGAPKHSEKDMDAAQKAQVSKWFMAIAEGDKATLRELDKEIAKEYEDLGIDTKAQNTGTNSAGGFLVPTVLDSQLRKKLRYVSPLRQIGTVINNMPPILNLPSENALPTVYWTAEGVAGTDSGSTFDTNQLVPHKLIGLDSLTHELLVDAAVNPSIQNFVLDRFTLALALAENDAFTNGDGTDRPYGFRSSAITPNSVAVATPGTNKYSDLVALKYKLNAAYRAVAVFVASAKGMQILESLVDTQGRPLFLPSLVEGRPDQLLGRPIYEVSEIPENLGAGTNETEIWFGMFSNYIIGDREGLRVDVGTNGTDFAADKLTLRVIKRVAGRPIIGESFAKLTAVR